jgi:putative ABC transport system permease protein
MTLGYELWESFHIAWGQIRAHVLRSALTALGVIIGIIAVTLMGSAIGGIEIGFERSLSVLGDDVLYVEKLERRRPDSRGACRDCARR